MYRLHFDGLFRGITEHQLAAGGGLLCYGWLITCEGAIVARGHGACLRIRSASSNVAEYLALIEGLDALSDMGLTSEPVMISGDAKTVIDQMKGISSVHSTSILSLYRRASRLAGRFSYLVWSWAPRNENRAADRLTRLAMRQARGDFQKYQHGILPLDLGDPRRSNNKFHSLLDLRVFQPVAVTASPRRR